MIALIFIASCAVLALGYRFYGAYLSRELEIDPKRPTPAHSMGDGVDYVPARAPILFGHHFSSIAGAGPIVGAIIAASWFGWLPALLWILVGAIFIGGMHDYGSLVVSIRHKARSVAEVCRLYLNPISYRFFLIFIWLALVYVLIVFIDMTAATFVSQTEADPHQGGTVATASVLYILLAMGFGLAIRRGLALGRGSLIFVPLVFGGLVLAYLLPTDPMLVRKVAPEGSFFFENPKYIWSAVLIVYCFVASITPVWILLQPRDYLSSFLLFACLGVGGAGLIISGLTGQVSIEYDAFLGLHAAPLGYLFLPDSGSCRYLT
ncbi:MAG: carbon starvation CstA family protein, partial [Myxococcota bacterium]